MRPPGPQHVRSGADQLLETALVGLLLAQMRSVSLSLFPRLFRERAFVLFRGVVSTAPESET